MWRLKAPPSESPRTQPLPNHGVPAMTSNKRISKRKITLNQSTSLMDLTTGEVFESSNFIIEDCDFNFEKAWLFHLADIFNLIGNKSIQILSYFFENKNNDNLVFCTQRGLANNLDISTATVNTVMQELKDNNIISMVQQGVYRVNPDLIFKGGHKKRMNVLFQYKKEKEEERSQNLSEIDTLSKEIEETQKRLNKLVNKLEVMEGKKKAS